MGIPFASSSRMVSPMLRCPAVRVKGSLSVELLQQPAPAAWAWGGQLPGRVPAAGRHGQLDAEGLVEPQPGLPELGLPKLHRLVHGAERLLERQDPRLATTQSGRVSPVIMGSTSWTDSAMFQVGSFDVAG